MNHLLNLTRPLFVLDTETTGTDPKTDRIVEIGFQMWTAEGMTKEWRSLVNPGVQIPAGATRVHGITNDRLRMCGACGLSHTLVDDTDHIGFGCNEFKTIPTFAQLAANLAKGLSGCDYAGQNVRFDLRIVAAEMQRAKHPWSYAGARILDSGRLEALAIPRSLSHLHKKYVGAEHDGAHGALSDVRAAATVIMKQLEAHTTLPHDLDQLHELQWPGYLTAEGEFRMVDGVPTCCFGQKHKNKPMRSIERGYWDWILRENFPDDVKTLAANAKLGKFPGEA